MPAPTSPSLLHVCLSDCDLPWPPTVAPEGREGPYAGPQDARAPGDLRQPVLRLLLSLSSTPRSVSGVSPRPAALLWAPAAPQPLAFHAALWAGAGRAHAGSVVCGGARDGHLAGAVPTGHSVITLRTKEQQETGQRRVSSRSSSGLLVNYCTPLPSEVVSRILSWSFRQS